MSIQRIQAGDRVLVHSGYGHMHPITVTAGAKSSILDTVVDHNDVIGLPYGTQMQVKSRGQGRRTRKEAFDDGSSHTPRKHVRRLSVLPFTPELWSLSLPHRTQIIFAHDIAMILMGLNVRPGCFALEAGTGSGSLTHALARAVRPHGHVSTCEFHHERFLQAQREFACNGIADVVSAHHGDICDSAFILQQVLPVVVSRQTESVETVHETGLDAVFLDIPSPWLFFSNVDAARILRRGGTVCTFSPCVEQVQKTRRILQESSHYVDVCTVEVLPRSYQLVRTPSSATAWTRLPWDASSAAEQTSHPSESHHEASAIRSTLCEGLQVMGGGLGHSAYLTFARKFTTVSEKVPEKRKEEEGKGKVNEESS